jgi:DtxR family transcriptional regulator, Mn-dependent transcriptional regulator
MALNHKEEYLGAIYRLRRSGQAYLPLSRIREHLGYSSMSVHEMIEKLRRASLIRYAPYRGVGLTPRGEKAASALVRRHRIWECFLTEILGLSWDEAHAVADRLEHAAPEAVTDRLSDFLGDPIRCPHGCLIPSAAEGRSRNAVPARVSEAPECRMDEAKPGSSYRLERISPEQPAFLALLEKWGLRPGVVLERAADRGAGSVWKMNAAVLRIPPEMARTLWVRPDPGSGERRGG